MVDTDHQPHRPPNQWENRVDAKTLVKLKFYFLGFLSKCISSDF